MTVITIVILGIIGVWVLVKVFTASDASSGNQFQSSYQPDPPLPGQLPAVQAQWLPGRGLVLASNQFVSYTQIRGRRFGQRWMTLDIEVSGRTPYTVQGQFLMPPGIEALPGSSLDVSVNVAADDPMAFRIVGPGGFSGSWINQGAPRPY